MRLSSQRRSHPRPLRRQHRKRRLQGGDRQVWLPQHQGEVRHGSDPNEGHRCLAGDHAEGEVVAQVVLQDEDDLHSHPEVPATKGELNVYLPKTRTLVQFIYKN